MGPASHEATQHVDMASNCQVDASSITIEAAEQALLSHLDSLANDQDSAGQSDLERSPPPTHEEEDTPSGGRPPAGTKQSGAREVMSPSMGSRRACKREEFKRASNLLEAFKISQKVDDLTEKVNELVVSGKQTQKISAS